MPKNKVEITVQKGLHEEDVEDLLDLNWRQESVCMQANKVVSERWSYTFE